ncbi:C45 family autoproteolytic acyltransferase/hydrolase [candidate division KSB1 bacterium]
MYRPDYFSQKLLKVLLITVIISSIVYGCNRVLIKPGKPVDTGTIVLEGSPYVRGLTHGRVLKKEIAEVVSLWKDDLKRLSGDDPDSFISKFLNKTDFIPAIRQFTPDLLEEVRGISDGSGIDFDTMLAFQLVDEIWLNARDVMGEHCSSLGVSRKGASPSMTGQNMDIEGFRNGFQTILHIKHENSDLESFVFTCPGFIATNGMNNRSIGVCVNAVMQLRYSREGLPVAFVIRGILEQETQDDAVEFLHKVNHASPQNYIIGGPEKVFDFECSSDKIVPYTPNEEPDIVYHTNHPIKNDDYNPNYKIYMDSLGDNPTLGGNSYVRFNTMEKRFRQMTGVIEIDDLKEILSSRDSERHPISRPFIDISSGFTYGSTIMVLSDNPEFHVSFGPPEVTNYKVFKFSK